MSNITCTGYHLEYNEEAANSHKFYTVIFTRNGVCLTNWGRIGTSGQSKIQKLPTGTDAADIGLRQLFAKKSKGYVQLHGDVKFGVSEETVNRACEQNRADPLTRPFWEAMSAPEFAGDKDAVFSHYDDLVNKAQRLMDGAGKRPFDAVYAEFEQLQEAWRAIEDKHAEAGVTISLIEGMLNTRLLTGSTL